MIWGIITEALGKSIYISVLVIVMMMLIESLNVSSHGDMLRRLARNRAGQVALATLLGAIPGCMGGYAAVSLYTNGAMSFGALVAMMIATCGDETFVMLAMFPGKALAIMAFLAVLAFAAGMLTDLLTPRRLLPVPDGSFDEGHASPEAHRHDSEADAGRSPGWRRVILFAGTAVFIAALVYMSVSGSDADDPHHGGLSLLSEGWMNLLFAILSAGMLYVLVKAPDSFVDGQLWRHIVCRHLPRTFAWTFGVLLLVGILTDVVDISGWISGNAALMVVLAALVGIIPESGPHLIFVTLYAGGALPLPVLLSSCIAQDGHACLPLLAESPRSFVLAKGINCAIAVCVGFAALCFL